MDYYDILMIERTGMKNKRNVIIVSCFLFVLGLILIGVGFISKDDSKYGYYTLKINKNGVDYVEESTIDCKVKMGGCDVVLPNASRKGGIVLGYSFNANKTTPDYKIGDTVTISSDKEIYVISYETHKMKVVTDSIDYIETADESCNAYNKNESCVVVPAAFNKEGYEVRGYSTNEGSIVGYIYPNTFYELREDIIVYPIWNAYTRGKKINVSESFSKGSMTYDVEEGCPKAIYDTFLVNSSSCPSKSIFLIILQQLKN